MKHPANHRQQHLEASCARPAVCPLSRVQPGAVVCIRELSACPELCARLRELGLVEDQHIRLLCNQSNFICQVCNARLGISRSIADSILVEIPADSALPA